ncbi:MAG: aminotransferase class I/II-fold pyridoxal phosphate-dependent enzyme [Ilumatobacteraceae bacterium]
MTDHLSDRGRQLVASPPFPPYLQEHFRRVGAREAVGSDYVGLCVAENKLVHDLLDAKITQCRTPPGAALGYGPWLGSPEVRRTIAQFLGRTVLGRPIDERHVAVLAGAGAVLETVFYCVADPGDGVLIPTPSYAGFWADLGTRDGLRILPVDGHRDDGFDISIEQYQRAYEAAPCNVRAMLITSPSNPLGAVYERDRLAEILDWADERGLHVVLDELYALSTYGDDPFVSGATLRERLGETTHVVWAFSKDFAMSGLRCGVLVSENEALLDAVDGLAYWSSCSRDTQTLLAALVSDDVWVDSFVTENQRRLRAAHDSTTSALADASIPFVPAAAGFFLLCDLRDHMQGASWDAERDLWRHLLDRTNVNLTPGEACRVNEPGFFRVCFAAEPTAAVVAGIGRIADHLRIGIG